jgi:hypothetical protein
MSDLNDQWKLPPQTVARRIEIADLPGFLGKDLPVESGTRAAFYESGKFVGELPPGKHPARSTFQSLFFWSPRKCSALLVRQGDLTLDYSSLQAVTSDLLEVEAALQVTARINDLGLFHDNLLQGRPGLTDAELREIVQPLALQGVSEAVGRLSLKDLVGPEARANLDAFVSQSLQVLRRYGLEFVRVATLSLSHPEYDAQRRRTGQLWLAREGLANEDAAVKLELDRRLASIRRDEELAELDNLARDVATDAAQGKLANLRRRVALRKDLRATFQAENFDKLRSEAELQAFLRQRDSERLLAEAEQDRLVATLTDQKLDRETQRQHLLSRLELEQQFDLAELRSELQQKLKLQTLTHESELARRNAGDSTVRFQEELERSVREQKARHEQELRDLEHLRATSRASGEIRRSEEWESMLHRQRLTQVEGDMELSRAQRQRQISLIEIEVTTAREQAQFGLEQRKAEWNLNRWKEIRGVKQSEAAVQHQQQAEAQAAARAQELEMLKAKSGLTPEQLLALSAGNAAVLGDVLKEQARQAGQATTNSEVQRLQQQLLETMQQREAGTVAAYKEALAAAQQNFQHMGGLVDSITRNLAPQVPPPPYHPGGPVPNTPYPPSPYPPNPPVTPPAAVPPVRVLLCQGCRAELLPGQRFCPNCGKPA